ncbi:MAG: cyclic pyranopterin phosphate synthase, partial [Kiritimatiellia bacterium]
MDGEASVYKLPGAAGSLGFISPITNPFCAGCNRVRLTADGMLRLCLLKDDELDLKGPLRAGMERDA